MRGACATISAATWGTRTRPNPTPLPTRSSNLKNLLGPLPYTSLVAAEIAAGLDATTILEHSPSFGGFIAAVKNGAGETDAS